MRKPAFDMSIFKGRRAKLAERTAGAAVVLFAHPEQLRNVDVHHPYRADTNLFYLTGWEEPESVFVFRPGKTPETALFVRPKDPTRETWDGFRYGPEGARAEFAVHEARLIEEFPARAAELLKDCDRVYYHFGDDERHDRQMIAILEKARASQGRTGKGLLPISDSKELLGELRVIKTADDVRFQRQACEISARAHVTSMKFTKPGVNERHIEATIIHSFLMNGAAREGYGSIVASGNGATTLHYRFNDQVCRDGDLLLIDAGAEVPMGFTGDITRTFPVNGKFTAPQKRVYEAVLRVQKNLIEMAKPGTPFKAMMDACVDQLTDELIGLGLLKGTRRENIESNAFRKYYPHGMGHYLGVEVHDAGLYHIDGKPREIEPGMVFTVEPGIYVPSTDSSAPAELRGIGVRIEDNVVVTKTGCEVLTSEAPKEVAELEAIIGRA